MLPAPQSFWSRVRAFVQPLGSRDADRKLPNVLRGTLAAEPILIELAQEERYRPVAERVLAARVVAVR